MHPPVPFFAVLISGGLILAASPAAAQHYVSRVPVYEPAHQSRNWAPSAFDWRAQLDRPGDYRCDAYWDAGRSDCGAGWRDQRHHVRSTSGYSYGRFGYERAHDRYPAHGGRQDHASYRTRGYGNGTAWYGAYGRPDLVYPDDGGRAGHHRNRDARRIDWCRASYRSYDPVSGYYRAYSGRLIFCG